MSVRRNYPAGVTDHEKYRRGFHLVDLNHAPGAGIIIVRAVVIHKNYFPLRYSYEFNCTSTDEVLEPLVDVST